MDEKGRNILAIVLVLTIIYSFGLTIWTYHSIISISESDYFTAKASSGRVSFCINTRPTINTSDCPNYAEQGEPYTCKMNATDPDTGASVYLVVNPISIYRPFANDSIIPFNMTTYGNITFTSSNEDVGAYNLTVTANDLQECDNSIAQTTWYLEINNTNDPPYLFANISNYGFNSGSTLYAFYLSNHFADPDDDPLIYTVSPTNNIVVQILPDGQVVLSATICAGAEYVMFQAKDPYNLTADSNLVRISCNNQSVSQTPTTGAGSASGGSGGAASLSCKAEYECYEYHKCNISNQKLMNCVDKEGCEDSEFVTLPCFYEFPKSCNESWSCSEWGICLPNGTQYRTCTDSNFCLTNLTRPFEFQDCDYIGTCSDGLKNCHDGACEEGIDCSGPCQACKSIQVPYPFQEEGGIWMYLFTGILLIALMTLLVYHYFRKEINSAMARVVWYLNRKKRKQYLLSKEDQKLLMNELMELEKKLIAVAAREDLFNIVNKYAELIEHYLSKVLKQQGEFDEQILETALEQNQKRVIPVLRRIFLEMYKDYLAVTRDAALVTNYKIRMLIEELRAIVLNTSPLEKGDYSREIQELKPAENDTFIMKMQLQIINSQIALQFAEIAAAKKKYLEIVSEYEKMTVKDEEAVYNDIKRLYDSTVYVNSWAWKEGKI